MKLFSYNSLASVLAVSLAVTPVLADSPFDDQTVTLQPDKTSVTTVDASANPSINTEVKTAENKTASATASVQEMTDTGIVTATALYVRTSPWGDIAGTLHKDDKVDIIGQLGDWYKIKYNGKDCYIHANWVTTSKRQGQTTAKYGTVNNQTGAKVYRTPDGDVISELSNGTQVYILGEIGEYYKIKLNDNEAFVSKKYIDTDGSASTAGNTTASSGSATAATGSSNSSANFTGYVTASALNVRTGAWGTIVGTLNNGDSVKVTGQSGDWYTIDYNGQTRYVSTKYISKTKPSASSAGGISASGTNNGTTASSGSLQERIVSCARALVGSTNFRGSDVSGGRLACAKVATTALKNAGALDKVVLNCRSAVKDLKAKGWVQVTPPPWQEGDVITWKTYDYTGDGVKDEDTHIGIILKDGNTFKAMNNSSSLRTPRISEINIAPISRVLRKVN